MRNSISFLVLIFLSLLLIVLGLRVGSFDIDYDLIYKAVFSYDASDNLQYIIVNLRLPRLILAFLVGGALAFSGYLMQAMVNNPLADPFILGTASGGSLGASLVYLIFPASMMHIFLPSFAAFIGAMTVTLVAVIIAYQKGQLEPTKLLLAGLALSSLTIALISFMIYFTKDEGKLATVIFWSMGSFELAKWDYIPLLLISIVIVVGTFSFLNKHLNVLLLGEKRSYNLGVNVSKLRWFILIAASIVTGFSVATCGPIGFVGLMVPHFTRGLYGVNGKYNIPYTFLLGGVFMLFCDIISRKMFPPSGIPIGIITSFLGIPFFVYLLSKKNYRFN